MSLRVWEKTFTTPMTELILAFSFTVTCFQQIETSFIYCWSRSVQDSIEFNSLFSNKMKPQSQPLHDC